VYPAKALTQNDRFPLFSHIPLEEAFRLLHMHHLGVAVAVAVVDLADPVITDLERNLISAHEKREKTWKLYLPGLLFSYLSCIKWYAELFPGLPVPIDSPVRF
jgi:hypothetical protein